MSERRAVKMAIPDKFRHFYAVLYQRRPKKMSENAERPARSGRGSGEKERPTTSSVRSGRAHSHGACVDAGIVHEFKL
jgi:hypothetical protein